MVIFGKNKRRPHKERKIMQFSDLVDLKRLREAQTAPDVSEYVKKNQGLDLNRTDVSLDPAPVGDHVDEPAPEDILGDEGTEDMEQAIFRMGTEMANIVGVTPEQLREYFVTDRESFKNELKEFWGRILEQIPKDGDLK